MLFLFRAGHQRLTTILYSPRSHWRMVALGSPPRNFRLDRVVRLMQSQNPKKRRRCRRRKRRGKRTATLTSWRTQRRMRWVWQKQEKRWISSSSTKTRKTRTSRFVAFPFLPLPQILIRPRLAGRRSRASRRFYSRHPSSRRSSCRCRASRR